MLAETSVRLLTVTTHVEALAKFDGQDCQYRGCFFNAVPLSWDLYAPGGSVVFQARPEGSNVAFSGRRDQSLEILSRCHLGFSDRKIAIAGNNFVRSSQPLQKPSHKQQQDGAAADLAANRSRFYCDDDPGVTCQRRLAVIPDGNDEMYFHRVRNDRGCETSHSRFSVLQPRLFLSMAGLWIGEPFKMHSLAVRVR